MPAYDRTTIRLHWLVVFLLASVWGCAQVIDLFPKGAPKINVRSIHMSLGLALGGVMLFRLWWRVRKGMRPPSAGQLAALVHWALYLLILAEVLLGLANMWGRGDTIYNLFKVSALSPGNKVLKGQLESIHAFMANAILAVVGLHAAAALAHHFICKDDVLRRMLPRLRAGSGKP